MKRLYASVTALIATFILVMPISAEPQHLQLLPQKHKVFTSEIFVKSNLTPHEFNVILDGTGLAGYGDAFYLMEQTHHVNGLAAAAVAMHESWLGTKPLSGNNYFGMLGCRFRSVESNIMFFGRLMNGQYYLGDGRTTLDEIGPIYCPDGTGTWVELVKTHMLELWHKIPVIDVWGRGGGQAAY